MRATSILLASAFAVFATAQTTTATTDSAPPATTTDPVQAAMIRCIEACEPGDVSCTSKCIAVPNPSESQVNDTNACVAGCPKGNGTEADNNAYRDCVGACIGEHYFTTSGTPQPTGGSGNGGNGNGNGNGKGNDNDDDDNNDDGGDDDDGDGNNNGDGDDNDGPSPTDDDGPGATETPNSAGMLGVSGTAVGLFGFLGAILAL